MTRVFVSSTVWDLVDVRAELEEHLRSLGLDPVLSDSSTSSFSAAPDGDSIRKCIVNLRESDVVIVVLSQHYGPALPPPWGPRSATHVEYDEALAAGKKLLVYVRDRTIAELDAWRAGGQQPLAKTRWTKQTEHQALFSLIEQHQSKLKNAKGEDNWRWTFMNSLELKRLVAKDLRRESSTAQLQALTATGRLPALSLKAEIVNRLIPTMFKLTIENHLPHEPAMDTSLDVEQQEGDKKRTLEVLGTISSEPAAVTLSSTHESKGAHIFHVRLRYSTITGFQLLETWSFHRGPLPEATLYCQRSNKEVIGRTPWA